ncbi:MAG TPA: hypothetical protein GX513_01950 [Firmicutes bacterium]|nr:hypothetical protein [Bacillota bacterium]
MSTQGRHPRDELLEAAWASGGFHPGSLKATVRAHLDGCPECRAFLNEVLAARRVAEILRAEAEVPAVEAEAAVRRALAAVPARRRQATPAKLTWQERLGFALMAAVVLGVQALLLQQLPPSGFLALELAVNWLAPFVFYIIFRSDNRGKDNEALDPAAVNDGARET